MGDKPGLKYTIERIDNNGPYGPWNCKWATQKEQGNNRRTNRFLSYKGITLTVAQWARRIKVNPVTIRNRLDNLSWSVEKALTTPGRKIYE